MALESALGMGYPTARLMGYPMGYPRAQSLGSNLVPVMELPKGTRLGQHWGLMMGVQMVNQLLDLQLETCWGSQTETQLGFSKEKQWD